MLVTSALNLRGILGVFEAGTIRDYSHVFQGQINSTCHECWCYCETDKLCPNACKKISHEDRKKLSNLEVPYCALLQGSFRIWRRQTYPTIILAISKAPVEGYVPTLSVIAPTSLQTMKVQDLFMMARTKCAMKNMVKRPTRTILTGFERR
jgi:hypothetical protein